MPMTNHAFGAVEVCIDYAAINGIFEAAAAEGRETLFEYEVYSLLRDSGAETPPRSVLLTRGGRPSDKELAALPGDRVVLKIVSPNIVHKTEVGGVVVVENSPDKIRSAWRRMVYEVPERCAAMFEHSPDSAPKVYAGLEGDALNAAIAADIRGVLMVEFMRPDSQAFGNELIVGIRRTREFGMVIGAGLGGTDTELYAERFRKGQAIAASSTALTDGETFFKLFRNTLSYKKLAGLTRGQRRLVTDEQLIECFSSFIDMANFYSPENSDAPFIIEELEINPFAYADYLMVPLDGMCRFSRPGVLPASRPVEKIGHLLHPRTIGIVGVSSTRMNFGRIILKNILDAGFDPEDVVVVRSGIESIDGVRCVESLRALEASLDLFVVAVGAEQVPGLVEEVIERECAESVMLIPGGLGETAESEERAREVVSRINAAHATGGGPVFLGGNCMGVVSRPGAYDTWFIPEEKLPKFSSGKHHRAAFISQSGAFMLTRLSQCPLLDPAYMVSVGNQTDLTLGDLVSWFADCDDVDVIAIYAEGFNDMDGLAFCRAVRRAVLAGKDVVFYKAGRTPEGKSATSGHTASLAGDYTVCESCVRQAGAVVAQSFTQFENLFMLAERLHSKTIAGNRLAAMSGAGFEAVGMADSIHSDDYRMTLAPLAKNTVAALEALFVANRLDGLVTVTNPLDITPGSNDHVHAEAIRLLAQDSGVDAVVAGLDPMSPVMRTLADPNHAEFHFEDERSIAALLEDLLPSLDTPVIGVVDGGRLYDPLVDKLKEAGLCTFRTSDQAVAALAQYLDGRLNAQRIRRIDKTEGQC
ncbi:acetate--CoA ligase family protein [Pseudodesulfovibrio piezophilus]|uniref:CoA-binding domain-containing protein n=1 Tax=Pseudodesulfovibrio piezophilus (strain DSM 21447 / JCM 15486 / C1TLV30) TaxID=1322246 RepID=M1WXX1_PSEP2|nr:acetate--CoA ligase family protein [Pseudodesulfovibrio piezophilus]CCH49983.1 CoA-binding domain-containing protein [Pseudodesulfovibrio piezophilus C1TLV30]